MAVRHFADHRFSLASMPQQLHRFDRVAAADVPIRLHDISTGLAIGIALLRGVAADAGEDLRPRAERVLSLIEDSMTHLRTLVSSTAAGADRHITRGVSEPIRHEAERLRLRLGLEVKGNEAWLAPKQAELICLVAREGLRNVSGHSGTSACGITIDLTTCPFVMRVRDWGRGVEAEPEAGGGISLLTRMAGTMGCRLEIGSQPGLGTDLLLIGPVCAKDRDRTAIASPS